MLPLVIGDCRVPVLLDPPTGKLLKGKESTVPREHTVGRKHVLVSARKHLRKQISHKQE